MGPAAGLIAIAMAGAADLPWLADARTRIEAQRGLAFEQPVTVVVQTEAELQASVREELDEELPPDRARAWSRTMEVFGVVAPGYDVRAELERLLGDHVAGYYNPQTRELYIVARPEDAPLEEGAPAERKVAEHELVHALQDQHFDLFDLTRRQLDNDDAGLAVRALIEGDATATMMQALADELDLPIDHPEVARAMDGIGQLSASSAAQLGDGLPFMVGSLVFPYIQGTRLTLALYDEGGWAAVDAAYRTHLPLSTEQVLHPEKLVGPEPDWPTVLRLPPTLGWARVDDGSLGELGIRLLIEHHLAGAWVETAAGWDGDRYEVYEKGDHMALLWLTTWDTESDAAAFADAAWGIDMPGGVHVVRDGLDVVVTSGIKDRKARRVSRKLMRKAERREISSLDDLAPRAERP